MINLEKLGWNSFFEAHFLEYKEKNENEYTYNYEIGRVSIVHHTICKVQTKYGEIDAIISSKIRDNFAELTGQTRFRKEEISHYPAVGDWVIITYKEKDQKAIIRGILPRMSKFSRNTCGRKRKVKQANEEVVAANINITFLVNALNDDFNPRRIERYLAAIWESGTLPVILLNKADLCDDIEEKVEQVKDIAFGVPIHTISAIQNEGLEQLKQYLKEGKTCIFLGSSGVGKSTIINKLLGEDRIAVQELSKYKAKGKHTTSYRELIILEDGGIVIDTPGMREIQLWTNEEGLNNIINDIFSDIEELITQCRFSNCTHNAEPDCAVKQAIENGELSEKRLQNYRKMKRELSYVKKRVKKQKDRKARISYNQKRKNIANHIKYINTN